MFKLELCFKTCEHTYEMSRLDKFREVSVEMFQCIVRCDCETVVQFLVLICFCLFVCLFFFIVVMFKSQVAQSLGQKLVCKEQLISLPTKRKLNWWKLTLVSSAPMFPNFKGLEPSFQSLDTQLKCLKTQLESQSSKLSSIEGQESRIKGLSTYFWVVL